VSIFALQFAVALGCPVTVISKSDSKLERCRSLGAVHTVNYQKFPDWDREVWKLSGQKGLDHILEVGGPGTLGKSLMCVAPGGHIALIGVLTGFGPPQSSLFSLVGRNANISGIYVGSRTDFEEMNKFLQVRQIRPVIDKTFRFDEAPAAYAYLASGQHFGKVVIEV
jgi:NADPH:quinone reductase-like Zn-dependent oxidoreductase